VIDKNLLSPPKYPEVQSTSDDPRLAHIISTDPIDLDIADVVIFGVPSDEGIRRNGGRVGASEAPNAIRQYLARHTPYAGPQFKHHINNLRIVDIGDVVSGELEAMHDAAQRITSQLVSDAKIVVALGGGHDVTYPLAKGFKNDQEIGLINIDAHLDVRPKKNGQHHSGSSFRLLLEEGIVSGRQFAEIGIQSFAVSREHFEWLLQQGSRILMFEDATTAHLPNAFEECEFAITHGNPEFPVYLSFDMDCVRASDAPGVSAPAPIGFLAEEVYELAAAAGLSKNVRMLDIVEVSPPHDIDGKTSRLAARMIAAFLAGVANRHVRH
jgi:formiminoglutamase